MIAAAASMPRLGLARRCAVWISTWSNFAASSGSPITPVEARKTSLRPAADDFAPPCAADRRVVSRPRLPVKALALPELTSSARALPLASAALHQSTGADGHFDCVNTPATVVPLSKTAEQHVAAVLVLDARLGGGEAHARRSAGSAGNAAGASGETVTTPPTAVSSLRRRRRRVAGVAGGGVGRPASAAGRSRSVRLGTQVVHRSKNSFARAWPRACGLRTLLEGRRRLLALLLDLDDVPAELRLDRRLGVGADRRARTPASSNGLTICAGLKKPRSPPLAPEPVSSDFSLAMAAKSPPLSRSAMIALASSSVFTRMWLAWYLIAGHELGEFLVEALVDGLLGDRGDDLGR